MLFQSRWKVQLQSERVRPGENLLGRVAACTMRNTLAMRFE